jgi:PiT family inorganic phosphate transporter
MDPFLILLGIAIFFDFLNGLLDSANVVATVISSRAMAPRVALGLAALANLTGPFLFGVAVATTVGEDFFRTDLTNINVIIAALLAAVVWDLATWYLGIPSSSSHALVGGLLGAGLLSIGPEIVRLSGLIKIVLILLISPPLGLMAGFLIMRLTLWALRSATPGANSLLRRFQFLTLIGLALTHGSNDAQKTMGVISLGLVVSGHLDSFRIPVWVIGICASAIALGTFLGGWRIIRTLGGRIYRIRPIHAFSSQISGALVILGAALVGGPVSTTQVLSSSIMGVGAAERLSKVRWTVLRDMLFAWLLTIPVTAALAALVVSLLPAW